MTDTEAVKAVARPAIKLTIGLIGLLILRGIVGILPGGSREIPGAGLELGTLLGVLLTALTVGVLVYFGNEVRERVTDLPYGTPESRRDASRVVLLVVVFVALLVAHGGLSPLVLGLALGATVPFVFDLVFLLAGLCVVLAVGYLLLDYVDQIADAVVGQFAGRETTQGGDGSTATGNGGDAGTTCPQCGSDLPEGSNYCGSCGTAIPSGSD